MEDQEEKQTVQAVKSRPGTFGLATKLNSQPRDDSIRQDEEDDGQKKNISKSTLEKLLQEEERRQQLTLARESTGSVIYDYDEAVTIPYSVEVQENSSAESTTTENISQNDVSEQASNVAKSTIEITGVITEGVPEQISDEGNQFSYTSESYTLEVSNEDEYNEVGDQSEAAAATASSSTEDDEKLFTNSKLSDTKNSLEILQISLANSVSTAEEDDIDDTFCDPRDPDIIVRKNRVGNFFRKLFGGGKKKNSE